MKSDIQIITDDQTHKQWFTKKLIKDATTINSNSFNNFDDILEDTFFEGDSVTKYASLFKLEQNKEKLKLFNNRFREDIKYEHCPYIEDNNIVSIITFDNMEIFAYSTSRGKDRPEYYIDNEYILAHVLREYFKTFNFKEDSESTDLHWKNINYLINISKLNKFSINDEYQITWS